MRAGLSLLIITVFTLGVAGTASGHVKSWISPGVVGPLRVGVLDCGDGSDPVLNISVGGFCFGTVPDGNLPPDYPTTSDCVPDSFGECVIGIYDLLFDNIPMGGVYCQDLDQDGICGGPILGDPLTTSFGEPYMELCGISSGSAFVIFSPLNPTPRARGVSKGFPISDPETTWAGHNWDPGHAIVVFMATVDRGNPVVPNPPECNIQIFEFYGSIGGAGCHSGSLCVRPFE